MVKFCLIGGKVNRDYISNKIESHLLSLINKEKPKILFCPYAAKDIEKTNNKFKELVKDLNCDVIYLNYNNIYDFDKLLNESDILYISGGISDDLVDIFYKYNLDKILIKYLDSNKIYAGISAGAMLYTKISMGDKYMYSDNFHNYNYKMVKCLGLLNISICPHYQNEDLIIYNDEIKKYNLDSFGIEEDSALIIDDNKYYVIKEKKNVSLYYFSKNDYIMQDLKENIVYEKDGGFRS